MLTAREKRMAQEVVVAFRQNVIGCDLLRTPDRTYVCDVNGWSFVKKEVRQHVVPVACRVCGFVVVYTVCSRLY